MFTVVYYVIIVCLSVCVSCCSCQSSSVYPFVVNTWGVPFTIATDAAYNKLISDPSVSAIDAVEYGCSVCEAHQCDGTVGFGGSPDESCETTLDAVIIDGNTRKSGSVANLRRVKDAITTARLVMDYTKHTLLAGDQATAFAVQNGLTEEPLNTSSSTAACLSWIKGHCQPNYRINVLPDPTQNCGPYYPNSSGVVTQASIDAVSPVSVFSHDTISMIVIAADGSMAAGTSTNGAGHKVPGRVGDGPITGSGSYVDSSVGGCGATGDGDVMMRFLPCYQAVESMRMGLLPADAAADAIIRIAEYFPSFTGAIVVVNRTGGLGAASYGSWTFTYAYRYGSMNATTVVSVPSFNQTHIHKYTEKRQQRMERIRAALNTYTETDDPQHSS